MLQDTEDLPLRTYYQLPAYPEAAAAADDMPTSAEGETGPLIPKTNPRTRAHAIGVFIRHQVSALHL